MGKKVISNTFTVNTIEDGTFPQQIFYRNQSNQAPATPATSQSDTIPSGWSATPQGVGGVYKYEWVSMRIKSDGVWGAYSTPAVYAYLAEDGTSISIKGAAIEIAQGTLPDALDPYEQDLSLTSLGDIILFDETKNPSLGPAIIKRVQPFIEDEKLKHFVVESVTVGDGYLIASKSGQAADEGHLYLATEYDDSGGDYSFWQDCGRIKGEKGDDAVVYELVPDVNVINANADGTITTGDVVLHAYRVVGSERSSDVLCYFAENQGEHAQFAIDNGSWTDCSSRGIPRRQAAETYIPAASVQSATTRIRLRLLDGNNAVCGVCPDITIVRNGAQGKIGRFFYFGGVFNSEDDDETHTFIVNDAQAPYFEHTENGQKRYHVFNYETNGSYTMAQMWAIRNDWNNKPWEVMTNDFKYIITQALFADFAKLGSWVFSGDYMLSQTGVDGTKNYQNFTGESGAWQPNLYMNALTGRLVGNNVNLRGVFNSYDAVYWNGIEMNAQRGYFKMSGPDVVEYDGKPWSRASIVDLFKIEFKDRESIVEGETTVRCIRMTIGDEDLNHIRIDSNDYLDGAVIRLGNSSKGAAVGTNLDNGNIPKMRFWDNYYNSSGEQRSMELDANGVRFKGGDGNYGNVRLTNEGVEVYNPNGTLWASKSWGRIIGFE